MAEFFENFQMLWWHWCLIGIVLLGLEMVLPGAVVMWIGCGAIISGLFTLLFSIESWQVQCVIFIPMAFISLFVGRRFIKKAAPEKVQTLNNRLGQYIGAKAKVAEAIAEGRGKIRLGDTLWMVQGPDCPEGTEVKVVGINGSFLLVEPLIGVNKEIMG